MLALVLCPPSPVFAASVLGIQTEAAVSADDNVTRAKGDDRLSDQSLLINASKTFKLSLSRNLRLLASGVVGGEKFNHHDGLSRYFAGLQFTYQYRPSGAFDAPTFGCFFRSFREEYESDLRDGYRHAFGCTVQKPITDRIGVSVALIHNERDGKSRVFDTEDNAARVNLDYSLPPKWGTLYLGAEYHRGDVVSTARPALEFVDIADAIVRDDAFAGGRSAYRFEAGTVLTTLGYNLRLGRRQSLDFAWRRAESKSKSKPTFPGAGSVRYVDNQISLAYLLKF